MTEKVRIHLYDISQGLAKQLSMQFIGKQLEGIWHTGVVVYGKEYYFGGGICCDPPEMTPFGKPSQKIEMGETEIPQELFIDFLKDISSKFTIETYNLFENNCNNFSDTVCEFLVGQGIPSYITGLPQEVLATPFGQMIRPLVDGFTNALNQNSHPMAGINQNVPQQNLNSNNNNNNNNYHHQNIPQQQNQNTNTSSHSKAVQEISTIEDFFGALDSSPAVIADFFSFSCPPCIQIKPFFEKLATDYQTKCPGLKFISINIQVARDIAQQFDIRAIPTFMGFYDALQVERFTGADRSKIEKLIKTLEEKVNSQQGEKKEAELPKENSPVKKVEPSVPASYRIFSVKEKNFVKFEGDVYTMALNLIRSTLEKYPKLKQAENHAIYVNFAKDPQACIKNFTPQEKAGLIDWILECIATLDVSDKSMGFLDVLKMISLDDDFAAAITNTSAKFERIVNFFDQSESGIREIQKGLRLFVLKLLANVTAHESTKSYFQANFAYFVKRMLPVAKACKDEKPAVQSVLSMVWNVAQNLFGGKEFDEFAQIIVGFALDEFFGNTDEDIVYLSLLILCSLFYYQGNLRSLLREKLDQQKLKSMGASKDERVGKAAKDLVDMLEGKFY